MIRKKRTQVLIAKDLARFFRAHGSMMTEQEYIARSDQPVRIRVVQKQFKYWKNLILLINKVDPTIEADLAPKPTAAPKAAPQKAAPKPKVTKDAK